MADKTRRRIDKTELPDAKKTRDDESVFVITDITFDKDARVRGYYFHAMIGREHPDTTYDGKPYIQESWILMQNSKRYLLQQAPRFNDKVFQALTLTPEQITGVKAEAIASIH